MRYRLSLVGRSNQLTVWQRWVRQPQKIWLRRALFQAHLWSGIAVGLYILMISVTGSVLVYSNELYRAATPQPIISKGSGPRLTDRQLTEAATRLYPGYRVVNLRRSRNPDQAVDVWLSRGDEDKRRLFDPRNGSDLGDSVPTGIRLVSKLIDLHDNLLAGATGRKVNGFGALAVLASGSDGSGDLVAGRQDLASQPDAASRRGMEALDLAPAQHDRLLEPWIYFGVCGERDLSRFPEPFQSLADRLEPLTAANAGARIGDRVIYWLAFLHFGRINGIGIPCSGPGLCDQTTKAIWAVFGLAPAAMFMTGAIMWWNRVLRPGWQALARRQSLRSA